MSKDPEMEAAWEAYRAATPSIRGRAPTDDEENEQRFHARLWVSCVAFCAGWEAARAAAGANA